MREVGNATVVRKEEVRIAMNNALALTRWHDLRFLQDFSSRDLTWLVIGALLAIGTMWVISRQRRRWF